MLPPESHAIWSLSDGRAGNARQASALAQALAGSASPAVVLTPGTLARVLAPRCWPGADHAFGATFADRLHTPPALAIGCGRQAALATRLLRRHGSRAVQILDPRIATTHWDLVVAPEHDALRGGNVITLLGSLHPVDDAWLQQARLDFAHFERLPSPRTTVLLGGDSRHGRFDKTALLQLLQRLEHVMTRDGGSVLLTASRRTDVSLFDALREFCKRWPGVCWLREGDGDNPYAGLLAFADRIVCTADSVNMISEACATRAPVFVHAPLHAQGRPRAFVDTLLADGRIRAVDDTLTPFPVTPLRETARIAAEVRRRLDL